MQDRFFGTKVFFSSIKQIQGSKGSALFPAFDYYVGFTAAKSPLDEAHNSSPNFLAADVKKANTSVLASNITEMRKDMEGHAKRS